MPISQKQSFSQQNLEKQKIKAFSALTLRVFYAPHHSSVSLTTAGLSISVILKVTSINTAILAMILCSMTFSPSCLTPCASKGMQVILLVSKLSKKSTFQLNVLTLKYMIYRIKVSTRTSRLAKNNC